MKRRALKLLSAAKGRPRLDRYELIAELAAGGMATVFLARIGGAGGFQRFVAIKRLHPHLAHEHDFVDMFLDEARLAAGIHHPNVVPILEVGESSAGYYQVMEYIEGDTLANLDRITREIGPAPLPVLLRIAVDALLGLHAAHERKDERGVLVELVHRDVSPQNILVGVDGTSRITDFGVARATTRLSSTRSGDLKGKLAYMAPEQVLGEPDLDRRADVFAMGTVVWEMLTGEHLFRGPNDAATMNRVLREPVPDVRAKRPEIPAQIAAVVAHALERDKQMRFATAADFAEALRAAGIPLATTPEVADFIDRTLGPGITERREAVRAWLAATVDPHASTGPASPEKPFDSSPTLEMERPSLPPASVPTSSFGISGSALTASAVGSDTAGASVVTSGGISSGPRLKRDTGNAWPFVIGGAVVLLLGCFGLFRLLSPTTTTAEHAAADAPPRLAEPVTSASLPQSASGSPSASAAPSVAEPAPPPPASASAARTTSPTTPTGKRSTKPGRVSSDLAASPY